MKRLALLFVLIAVGTSFAGKKHEPSGPCTKNVSFSAAMQDGVHPYMVGWIQNWIKKNQEKHSDVCFNQRPMAGVSNFVIVVSDHPVEFSGVQLVSVTNTSTTNFTGSGDATNNSGESWNFSYSGSATTTSTSSVPVSYTMQENTLFATAYDSNGGVVGQRNHLYATQEGGDPNSAFGTNLGNALRAINARGRLLTGVIKDIEKTQ